MEDGYVKFKAETLDGPMPQNIEHLKEMRDKLHNLHLIGVLPNKIGFGNISIRRGKRNQFIISGTATGSSYPIESKHFTKVTKFNLKENSLTSKGPIKASSESMTHGAIYKARSDSNAVIHVHSDKMWNTFIDFLPTTKKEAEYGTPEMGYELQRLAKESKKNIVVMAGHRNGVIAFGKDLHEAYKILMKHYKRI